MDDLFSSGFAWGDEVSQTVATPVCDRSSTAAPSCKGAPAAPLSDAVASVASVANYCDSGGVSQETVASLATPVATAKPEDFGGVQPAARPAVATVASVANWRIGLAQMDAMRPGPKMAYGRWSQVIRDGLAFLDTWAEAAIAAGWDTLDVFGTNPNPLHTRVDRLGLIVCVGGRAIEGVSATRAVIGQAGGKISVFDRTLRTSGGVPVWDLGDWNCL